jgi:hypothetical protein
MFDGHFRTSVDRAVKPLGDSLRRTKMTPDHLTIAGMLPLQSALGIFHLVYCS